MFLTILGFGFLILIHELGHFLMAVKAGVKVEEFSVGFGRRIFSRLHGSTLYSLAIIPLGGFVRFEKDSLESASPFTRILISIAGPGMNILFALLLFFIVGLAGVPQQTARIGELVDGMPAKVAGLRVGDLVVGVDSTPVKSWTEMISAINSSKESALTVKVGRDSGTVDIIVKPEIRGGRKFLGVRPADEFVSRKLGVVKSAGFSLAMAISSTKDAFSTFSQLFTGATSLDAIGGPIMIAQEGSGRSKGGIIPVLLFLAVLSANLFVLNMFPLPVLDGGHICFAAYEQIFGKPVGLKAKQYINWIGATLLLGLIVIVCANDIFRLFRR